jgi:hypothetical protein
MDEDQKKAMADLDALWGAGASESVKACVEQTDALIDAAKNQQLPVGLRVPRHQVSDASLAIGALFEHDESSPVVPEVNIDLDLQHQVDNPGADPVYVVYAPGMTQEQLGVAQDRLHRHNGLMLGARMLQSMAKKILMGELD